MLAEPLLLLHTPTHAAAHNTTQHAGCCGQQPTLAYTPCHVRQENYANLVTDDEFVCPIEWLVLS